MTDEVETPQWEIKSLHHAYQERTPTEYVVDKFFETESLNIVFGAPGSMKSMFCADLCAHVAGGKPWLPGVDDGIPLQQANVFWLDMDNGNRRTDQRIDAVSKAQDLPIDSGFYYLSMPNPSLVAGDFESMVMLRDTIIEHDAKLVVIDNLGLITGDVEENSAGMAIIMGNLRRIAERTKAAIIIIHHQRKGGAGGGRAGDSLRGHSSIEASIDLALHIVREPDQNDITVRSTKTRGVDVPPISATFNYEHIEGTNDLSRAWFSGQQVVRGENDIHDTIIFILEGHDDGMNKELLMDRVRESLKHDKPGVNKVRAWLNTMIGKGEILETKRSQYKWIHLP